MKIGLLGGTFDPIHSGHVAIAEEVRIRMGLGGVRLIPCHLPPHKERPDLTPGADRLAMIALGTQDSWHLIPSSLELARPAPSYTIDTLRYLSAAEPQTQFFFIMGMDSFHDIETWKDYDDLLREYHVVVVNRPGTRPLPPKEKLLPGARKRLVDSCRWNRDTSSPAHRASRAATGPT